METYKNSLVQNVQAWTKHRLMWIKFSKEILPCHAHTGKLIGPHAWQPLRLCTIAPFTFLQKTPS